MVDFNSFSIFLWVIICVQFNTLTIKKISFPGFFVNPLHIPLVPDVRWLSVLPNEVPINSCQEFDWEFELIVTFPHASTTANFSSVPQAVLMNITEVNWHIANYSPNLTPNLGNYPIQFPNDKFLNQKAKKETTGISTLKIIGAWFFVCMLFGCQLVPNFFLVLDIFSREGQLLKCQSHLGPEIVLLILITYSNSRLFRVIS